MNVRGSGVLSDGVHDPASATAPPTQASAQGLNARKVSSSNTGSPVIRPNSAAMTDFPAPPRPRTTTRLVPIQNHRAGCRGSNAAHSPSRALRSAAARRHRRQRGAVHHTATRHRAVPGARPRNLWPLRQHAYARKAEIDLRGGESLGRASAAAIGFRRARRRLRHLRRDTGRMAAGPLLVLPAHRADRRGEGQVGVARSRATRRRRRLAHRRATSGGPA